MEKFCKDLDVEPEDIVMLGRLYNIYEDVWRWSGTCLNNILNWNSELKCLICGMKANWIRALVRKQPSRRTFAHRHMFTNRSAMIFICKQIIFEKKIMVSFVLFRRLLPP